MAAVVPAVVASSLAGCSALGPAIGTGSPANPVGIFGRPAQVAAADRNEFMQLDLPKARRMMWGRSRSRDVLPTHVDLRPAMSPVGDQLAAVASACTGFAIAGVAEYMARLKGETPTFSAGFIYVLELFRDGHPGSPEAGSFIETGMGVWKDRGIAPEALHPFMTPAQVASFEARKQYCSTPPTKAAMTAALSNRITAYSEVKAFGDLKAALAKGKPVPFLFAIYPGFRTPECAATGMIPVPDPAHEQQLGLHAVVAVGYDDAKQVVIVRHCRGPRWGDQGYGFMPYAYFQKDLVGDAWQVD
jgi:hypothetical protein